MSRSLPVAVSASEQVRMPLMLGQELTPGCLLLHFSRYAFWRLPHRDLPQSAIVRQDLPVRLYSGDQSQKEAYMSLRASDVMVKDVLTVPDTTPLKEVARLFGEKKITGAPVINAQGEL